MLHAALAARSIGFMQQAAMAACIIFKYLHATMQHFTCCPKWRHAIRSVVYTSRGVCYARNFLMKLVSGINYSCRVKNQDAENFFLKSSTGFQVKADKPESICMPLYNTLHAAPSRGMQLGV